MRRLFLVVAFVELGGALAAQSPPQNAAILVGRILDAVDSGAIANAGIQVLGTKLDVRSDGRGRFRIAGVPAGAHEIEARSFRYSAVKRAVTFVAGDSVRLDI